MSELNAVLPAWSSGSASAPRSPEAPAAASRVETGATQRSADVGFAAQPGLTGRVFSASRLLRSLGGLILLASFSTFLFQQWQTGDGIERYLLLLGQTALVTVAGLACGLALQETKGARTFLLIALAGLPVHFVVLAGLIYSRLAWDGGPTLVGGPFLWTAPSIAVALIVAGLALPILSATALVGFRVLARPRAVSWASVFIGCGALLLLPVRLPAAMAAVVVLQALLVGFAVRAASGDSRLATLEGRLAGMLLGVPCLLTIGRTLVLYDSEPVFRIAVWGVGAAVLLLLSREGSPKWRTRAEVAALVPLGLGVIETVDVLLSTQRLSFVASVAGLGGALCLLGLSQIGFGGSRYRSVAAWSAVLGTASHVVVEPGPGSAFLCLVSSLVVVGGAFVFERRVMLVAGLLGSFLGLAVGLAEAVSRFSLGRWGVLAVAGTAAILGASVLERYGSVWFAAARGVRDRVVDWDG